MDIYNMENPELRQEIILPKLNNIKELGIGEYMASCPAHEDKNPSLSVTFTNDKTLLFCHAGCDYLSILKALGRNGTVTKSFPYNVKSKKKQKKTIVEIYDYRNSEGKNCYQNIRYDPKDFSQRESREKWHMRDVQNYVPYRLPELNKAINAGETVLILEGEKDVNNAIKLGVTATTFIGGANKWRGDYKQYFNNCDILLIPDNDDAGRLNVERIAKELQQVAKRIRVLELPGLQEKGDLSDWINQGGTKEALLLLIQEKAKPLHGTEPCQDKLPEKTVKREFSEFIENNWLIEGNTNETLKELVESGAGLWLDNYGHIIYRANPTELPAKLEKAVSEVAIANKLRKDRIKLFTGETPDIFPSQLQAVTETFDPFVQSEFYDVNGITHRTSFKPSIYLKKTIDDCPNPGTIKKLIWHLVAHNEQYYKWVINWIAGFFQTLKKSQVALVFRGDQGAGKGIFFNEILSPLFGQEFSITVDDDRLVSNFKNWIPAKLFYNLNEISKGTKSRKNVKNFIKQLVTDPLIQSEKKYENSMTTRIFGNVLITSNETYVLEIEPSDRRYTVIKTGKDLKKSGWDMKETIKGIRKELHSFSQFLKGYNVNWVDYNQALDTPEKNALVEVTTDRFTYFVSKIKECNAEYFKSIAYEVNDNRSNPFQIEKDVQEAYNNGFTVDLIVTLFRLMNDDEEITPRKLMKKLRAVDPILFQNAENSKESGRNYKANGKYYYIIK